jgi:hypothetical protein
VSAAPPTVTDLQQRNLSAILKALAEISQVRVAERMGLSGTTVSRMKDEELERFALLLAACNLVVQPRSYQAIDPEKLRALKVLARDSLEQETRGDSWGGGGFDADRS